MRRKNATTEMMKSYLAQSLLILLETKNFQNITIAEIAKRAGVNRSTYYRHFNSKEDIVFYYFDALLRQYIERCRIAEPTPQEYLRNMFGYFLDYKNEMLLLHQNGLSLILLEVLNKHFRAVVPDEADLAERYKSVYHIGGIFNYFLFWFSRGMEDEPDELMRAAAVIFPNGISPYLY